MNMVRGTLFFVSLIVTAVLMYLCAVYYASVIEDDIKARLAKTLVTNGISIDDINVDVFGRDVLLTGETDSPEFPAFVKHITHSVRGVRGVSNQIFVTAPPPLPGDTMSPHYGMPSHDQTREPSLESHSIQTGSHGINDHAHAPQGSDQKMVDHQVPSHESLLPMGSPALETGSPPDEAMLNDVSNAGDESIVDTHLEHSIPEAPERAEIRAVEDMDRHSNVHNQGYDETQAHSDQTSHTEDTPDSAPAEKEDTSDPAVTLNADACQTGIFNAMKTETIEFDPGEVAFHARSLPLMDRLIGVIQSCDPSLMIHIHGHTDNTGNAEKNQDISLRRTRSVATYLVRNGVTQTIMIKGFGGKKPIASNDTDTGKAQNRRIEFKVTPAREKQGQE